MVPTVVLTIASNHTSSFSSYASIGKIRASETQVSKPSILNMATN